MAFSQEVADEICKRLMGGASMREVCAAEDMPARSVVYEWLAENPAFADQYARAAEVRADEVFDEMFAIADNGENDWMQRAGKDEETAWWKTAKPSAVRSFASTHASGRSPAWPRANTATSWRLAVLTTCRRSAPKT